MERGDSCVRKYGYGAYPPTEGKDRDGPEERGDHQDGLGSRIPHWKVKEKTENKTVIIVAQRISTIMNANQIIVLEEGKIVGKGTHEELMENCETYKQIALSQLSEEELKVLNDAINSKS